MALFSFHLYVSINILFSQPQFKDLITDQSNAVANAAVLPSVINHTKCAVQPGSTREETRLVVANPLAAQSIVTILENQTSEQEQ